MQLHDDAQLRARPLFGLTRLRRGSPPHHFFSTARPPHFRTAPHPLFPHGEIGSSGCCPFPGVSFRQPPSTCCGRLSTRPGTEPSLEPSARCRSRPLATENPPPGDDLHVHRARRHARHGDHAMNRCPGPRGSRITRAVDGHRTSPHHAPAPLSSTRNAPPRTRPPGRDHVTYPSRDSPDRRPRPGPPPSVCSTRDRPRVPGERSSPACVAGPLTQRHTRKLVDR